MKLVRLFFLFIVSFLFFIACNSPLNVDDNYNKGYKEGFQDGINAKTKNEKVGDEPKSTVPTDDKREANSEIPQKVYETIAYIQKNNRAPDGYVGGRHFGNFEKNLPEKSNNGNKIDYKEYDVNPKQEGKNRGVQRLVIGDDGRAWYTNNHYKSFVEVK